MSTLIAALNVECLNIAELKPALDQSKGIAVGEFLAQSLYLQAYELFEKGKT